MKKQNINILENLIAKRDENLKLHLSWSIEDIERGLYLYNQAFETACEENRMETSKILEEKISQLRKAKKIKLNLFAEVIS
jgi:hypothetical protein